MTNLTGEAKDSNQHEFPNSLEASLRDDVDLIRNHPYIREELAANTVGMIYDLQTGLVRQVDLNAGKRQGKDEL